MVTWESTVSKKKIKALGERECKRQKVIHELIQTEQGYLGDLVVIKNLFRQSIQDADVLTKDEIFGLFCNLDEVIAANGELFERLVSQRKDGVTDNVADVFLEMFAGQRFDAYLQFCANQLPASELYGALKEKNAAFTKVMATCQAKTAESKGFDLPAFLLKGMQRLLKYHPLLQQILKRTEESNLVQIQQLTDAMRLVEEHGRRVNERVRASENARRLYKIKDALVRDGKEKGKKEFDLDITADPERHLIYEGRLQFIRLQSGSTGPKMVDVYVILLSDMLLITMERDDKYVLRGIKEPPPVVMLDTLTDVKAEVTDPRSRARTTLSLEVSVAEPTNDHRSSGKGKVTKDSPRPGAKASTPKQYYRFLASSQGALRSWIVYLHEARQSRRDRMFRLEREQMHPGSVRLRAPLCCARASGACPVPGAGGILRHVLGTGLPVVYSDECSRATVRRRDAHRTDSKSTG